MQAQYRQPAKRIFILCLRWLLVILGLFVSSLSLTYYLNLVFYSALLLAPIFPWQVPLILIASAFLIPAIGILGITITAPGWKPAFTVLSALIHLYLIAPLTLRLLSEARVLCATLKFMMFYLEFPWVFSAILVSALCLLRYRNSKKRSAQSL